ncbi:MAG: hypothetical protein ACXWQO_11565 [Bdellovibrionota bacterium]
MANAKKIDESEDEIEADEKPAYIDWQEFNRMIKGKQSVPRPEEDSKDDDAADELEEAVIGKDYVDEDNEEPSVLADTPSAARTLSNRLEDVNFEETAPSSERPDPVEDLDAETDTH